VTCDQVDEILAPARQHNDMSSDQRKFSATFLIFLAPAGLEKNLVFQLFSDGFSEPASQPVTQDKQPISAMATSPVTRDG
jgi:hypothetical protein